MMIFKCGHFKRGLHLFLLIQKISNAIAIKKAVKVILFPLIWLFNKTAILSMGHWVSNLWFIINPTKNVIALTGDL